jgi:Neutral/alkaline non-lysosomal ceramidase, N-terminal
MVIDAKAWSCICRWNEGRAFCAAASDNLRRPMWPRSLMRDCRHVAAGPGAFDFTQGDTNGTTFWRIVRDFLHVPTTEQVCLLATQIEFSSSGHGAPTWCPWRRAQPQGGNEAPLARPQQQLNGFLVISQVACQAPKPILLDTGSVHLPYSWQPAITEISIFRVGEVRSEDLQPMLHMLTALRLCSGISMKAATGGMLLFLPGFAAQSACIMSPCSWSSWRCPASSRPWRGAGCVLRSTTRCTVLHTPFTSDASSLLGLLLGFGLP